MILISSIGSATVNSILMARRIAAYVVGVLQLAFDVRHWSAPVKRVFSRQIYFSGVKALSLLLFLAILMGASVVAPVQLWLSTIGQSALLGSVLVSLVVRGVGPLLVGFLLIGRSGTAVCAELAGMRSRGEIHVLEAQGIDTAVYLVMPRALALALSNFALSVFFVTVSLVVGWLVGLLVGFSDTSFMRFLNAIVISLAPADILAFVIKGFLGGLLIGVICCVEGLSTKGLSTEIPQAVTKGVVLSMATLLIVSALISLAINY